MYAITEISFNISIIIILFMSIHIIIQPVTIILHVSPSQNISSVYIIIPIIFVSIIGTFTEVMFTGIVSRDLVFLATFIIMPSIIIKSFIRFGIQIIIG